MNETNLPLPNQFQTDNQTFKTSYIKIKKKQPEDTGSVGGYNNILSNTAQTFV